MCVLCVLLCVISKMKKGLYILRFLFVKVYMHSELTMESLRSRLCILRMYKNGILEIIRPEMSFVDF